MSLEYIFDSLWFTCDQRLLKYLPFLFTIFQLDLLITPRYSWNTAKIGDKHKSINQSINRLDFLTLLGYFVFFNLLKTIDLHGEGYSGNMLCIPN